MRRGTLIVIAGPSGVGKGTVIQRLLSRIPDGPALSVSVTTRAPRPGELEGVQYHFVTDAAFDRMVADGSLLEWAEIVGHRSGTPRRPVEELLTAGRDVILEIDVKGAEQVRARVPEALLIFLEPPSLEVLEQRLRDRGTETEVMIEDRLRLAARELEETAWFDAVVVNDDADRAADEVAAIIEASRTT